MSDADRQGVTGAPEGGAPLRVLILSSGIPHERDGASTVLFYHYVKHVLLAGHAVLQVLLLEGDGLTDADVESYRHSMVRFGPFEVAALRAPRFVRQRPFAHELIVPAHAPALDEARSFNPDVTLAFDVVPAWMAETIQARRRVVWLGDLHFHTIRLHANYSALESPSSLISFPKHWLAARVWRRAYREALAGTDAVIVSSASSVGEMAALGIDSEYQPYPWPGGSSVAEGQRPALPTFLFFGTLAGLGSRSALHLLANRIYAQMLARWKPRGFRILIAGRGELPKWFANVIVDKPEFQWLGFVPDIDSVITACHAVFFPIDVAVGNRSRILTAMSKGALVIAHRNVALGNPALVDGRTCALASTPQEFIDRMVRSVEDECWAHEIAARGRHCYEELFSPERAAAQLIRRLRPSA